MERRRIRSLSALVSGTMALNYYLIGLGDLDIGGTTTGETADPAGFGFSAGCAFLILSLLLLFTDRRWLWTLAAVVQVLVFIMYFAVSGVREPPFEVWGILLRMLQVVLLATLVYLAWRPTTQGAAHAT
jgi:hypothetical protein